MERKYAVTGFRGGNRFRMPVYAEGVDQAIERGKEQLADEGEIEVRGATEWY